MEVYVQLSMANETFPSDTLRLKEEKKRIFEHAGVTPEQIDNFVAGCRQKPQKWVRVWEKIVKRLSEAPMKEEGKQESKPR